ncbi:MAG: hypothetical protein HY675_00425 [Chloroflexi bacterium]|nr:hypothetical protein [Chloroflexota bacterium]
MKYEQLVEIVGDEPVFETGLLLAGKIDPNDVRRQLSRWTEAGRILQLRRGLYAVAPPFQKAKPHPFVVANRLVHGSYVSCESGLAHYGMIPEAVPVVTSVTTGRPGRWDTPLGSYLFHHIKRDMFFGYSLTALAADQQAFVASPEKALLDLIYLRPGGHSMEYLRELRLQNLDALDPTELDRQAHLAKSKKLAQAARLVKELRISEATEYAAL